LQFKQLPGAGIPVPVLYVPLSQSTQVDVVFAPDAVEYVPVLHFSQSCLFATPVATLKVPASHSGHAELLVAFKLGWYVPRGHAIS